MTVTSLCSNFVLTRSGISILNNTRFDEIVSISSKKRICRILSLDGGGAKGFYTLGILHELEAAIGTRLGNHFDLIFGTSTGSIIASLLALGKSVDEIYNSYCTHVPSIMKARTKSGKSAALKIVGEQVLGDVKFEEVITGLGIVSVKWQLETPMIFKSLPDQAHGRHSTFIPGFGCTIAEAVEASCSAYPFFDRKTVVTSSGDSFDLMDGGYCANNPSLYAIADATSALRFTPEDCRLLSLGCGHYPEPKSNALKKLVSSLLPVQLLQKTLNVNTLSMDTLRQVLFFNVPTVRVSETYSSPDMATDLFEHDMMKLNLLRRRGRESFGLHELSIRELLELE